MFRPVATLVRRVFAAAALLAALPLGAQDQIALDSKKDMLEVQSFHITMPIIKMLIQSQEAIYTTIAANPGLVQKYQAINATNDPNEPQTLDVLAARFERAPEIKEQIENAGLTPRMYLLATMAFIEAVNAAGKLETPGFNRRTLPPSVLANVYFMEANQAELGPMMAHVNEMEQKMNAAVAQHGGQPAAAPASSGPPDRN